MSAAEGFDGDADLRRPDFFGVVLDPTGVRIDLFELTLGGGVDVATVVINDGAGAGGALIEREYVFHRVT